MTDDDARLFQISQIDLGLKPEQVVKDTRRNVTHIGGALAQIIILDGGQRCRVTLGYCVECVLRVDFILLDDARYFIQQRAIFQHEQVRIENAAFLGAHGVAYLVLDLLNLATRFDDRLLQPINFLRSFPVRDSALAHRGTGASKNEGFSPADARGDRDAPECFLPRARWLSHGSSLANGRGVEK